MAGRPERHDADYFPFYAKDGKTLFILEGKYGCKGTGFFTNVLRFLTLQKDHYFCIADDADREWFFAKMKCDELSGMEMLHLMSKTGKLYSPLWISRQVIVSPDLLESLKPLYQNRKNEIITIDEILISYPINAISETGNTQEPVISEAGNTQSKVKKSKVKKRKESNKEKFTAEFLRFYTTYPKRIGRDAAWKAWQKRNGDRPDIETIISAIQKQQAWRDNVGIGEFRPEWKHPATWLNQGCWADDVEETK